NRDSVGRLRPPSNGRSAIIAQRWSASAGAGDRGPKVVPHPGEAGQGGGGDGRGRVGREKMGGNPGAARPDGWRNLERENRVQDRVGDDLPRAEGTGGAPRGRAPRGVLVA